MTEIEKGYIIVPCPDLKCDGEAKVFAEKMRVQNNGRYLSDLYFNLGHVKCLKCNVSFSPFPFADPLYNMTFVTLP